MSGTTDKASGPSLLRTMARGKHGLLLLVLLAVHVLGPLTKLGKFEEEFSLVMMTAVLVVGVRSVLRENKRLAKVFFTVLGVSITLMLASFAFPGAGLLYLALIGFGIFYAELIRVILVDVLRPGRVDVDRIMGTLAAYMLLATFWTVLYLLLQAWVPSSFDLGPHPRYQELVVDQATGEATWEYPPGTKDEDRVMAPIEDLSYFSFVTITTLGYGDIAPQSELARRLATLEAMVGPIYLAVLLARLVSLNTAQTGFEDVDEDA